MLNQFTDLRSIEESIRQFLRRPDEHLFDQLAVELARLQSESEGSTGEVTDKRPSEPLGVDVAAWPGKAATPRGETFLPADRTIVEAAAEELWSTLAPPPAAPLMNLVTGGTIVEATLSSLMRDRGADDLVSPLREGRLDGLASRSWMAARQRAGHPVWIVSSLEHGTALIADLARRRLRFRLPPGSRALHLHRSANVPDNPTRHASAFAERVGIALELQTFLIDVPTLASPIHLVMERDGQPVFAPPGPWTRYRVRQGREVETGGPRGRLEVFDLATTRLPWRQLLDWPVVECDGKIRFQVSN